MSEPISFHDPSVFSLLPTCPHTTDFYYYPAALPPETVRRILDLVAPAAGRAGALREGTVAGTVDPGYRSSRIAWIPKDERSAWLYKELVSFVRDANEKMWRFDVSNLWEDIQFTEYDAAYAGHYDWHMDVGGEDSSTRKLSVSVQLSDPADYDGGELEFMVHRSVVQAERSLAPSCSSRASCSTACGRSRAACGGRSCSGCTARRSGRPPRDDPRRRGGRCAGAVEVGGEGGAPLRTRQRDARGRAVGRAGTFTRVR